MSGKCEPPTSASSCPLTATIVRHLISELQEIDWVEETSLGFTAEIPERQDPAPDFVHST